MTPRLIAASVVFALLALAGFGCYVAGKRAERVAWQAAETERMTAIAEAVGDTVQRANALAVEVEALRARPERIRTVTRTVHVQADAECRSLPESVRLLWNADPDVGPPAGPARVVNGLVPRMAGDAR